jgi:tripartite-type tricarboxylate transporter receptor subunit TctC
MKTLGLALTTSLALLLPMEQALAQPAWPAKPVRIIVPFAAGSFTDIAARAIGAELTGQTGQQVLVENRGGAGGTIGADAVAKAAPDGYTLLLTDNSFVISPGLYARLPYDPQKDLVPVSTVAEAPAVMVARTDLPAKTLKEVVDAARAQPRVLTFGSGGQGSSAHLATEMFLDMAGVQMLHVPFKGVAAALADVVAKRIDVTIGSVGSASGHVTAGRVRGLAVTGKARSPLLPDVPTFAESGYPGYDMVYWFGVFAPAATPPAVLGRLHDELERATATAKIQEMFARQGVRPVTSSAADFARRVSDETRRWRDVVAKAGVKVE